MFSALVHTADAEAKWPAPNVSASSQNAASAKIMLAKARTS